MQISIGEIITAVVVFVGLVAWFVRLEAKLTRASERIEDLMGAIASQDNRMNSIDGKIISTLDNVTNKLEIVNSKSNRTAESLARIEGVLFAKDKLGISL